MKNQITPEIKELPDGFIVVSGLPSNGEFHRVDNGLLKYECTHNDYSVSIGRIVLPQGPHTILGFSDQPEVAEQVVEKEEEYSTLHDCYRYGYKDYSRYHNKIVDTATESLSSLLRSLGIEDERVLILRKD